MNLVELEIWHNIPAQYFGVAHKVWRQLELNKQIFILQRPFNLLLDQKLISQGHFENSKEVGSNMTNIQGLFATL